MREADIWVHWWAFAWRDACPGWHGADDVAPALARNRHAQVGKLFAIAPCLPCAPSTSLLYLARAKPWQYDSMLQLIDSICRPSLPTQLEPTQRLWAQRLARALRPQGWLEQSADALQLLRAWVEPPVWQRLRLRFAPARVIALEQEPVLAIPASRLEVLWRAVVWYERTLEAHENAVTAHD